MKPVKFTKKQHEFLYETLMGKLSDASDELMAASGRRAETKKLEAKADFIDGILNVLVKAEK